MNYVHLQSELFKFSCAAARSLVTPSSPGKGRADFLRECLKFPLTYQASKAIEGVPVTTVAELFSVRELPPISISLESLDRHPWNIRLDEEVLIGFLVQSLGARRIFEIGTFDGGTTRVLADKAGEDAEVFTLDLPEVEFNLLLRQWEGIPSRSRSALAPPNQRDRTRLGMKLHGGPAESRIKQLFGNSLEFDFSLYEGSIDLVFVDAMHDYPHGISDSRAALRLVRPGGIVLWHDFDAGFPDLVRAIIEATEGLPLKRLGIYTSLACLRVAN